MYTTAMFHPIGATAPEAFLVSFLYSAKPLISIFAMSATWLRMVLGMLAKTGIYGQKSLGSLTRLPLIELFHLLK